MSPPPLHCINPDCPAPYPQPPDHKFCQRCGTSLYLQQRYIPRQRLGAGGFATIFTVWDELQQVEKVLKVLTVASEKALQLFAQEALVLRSLRHPGVPSVESGSFFEVKTPDRKLYCLVMEQIAGRNLEDLLLSDYPQGCPELLVYNWLVQATAILDVLHRRQIVHRDIKPSNLMLRQSTIPQILGGDQVVLIDFGGAKQIDSAPSSTRLFSSGYSPPEQMSGGGVEPATDIYALGRTAIHLLTNRHPSELEDLASGRLCWRHLVPVDSGFAELLDAMVEPVATVRPASARRLQQRLAGLSALRQRSRRQTRARKRRVWRDRLAPWQARGLRWRTRTRRGFEWASSAVLETIWSVVLGSTSAAGGLLAGGLIVEFTAGGREFASALEFSLRELSNLNSIAADEAVLPFALAGFCTAWGLAEAGSFQQRHHPVLAGLSGSFGYALGWLLWENLPYAARYRFGALAIATVVFAIAGLGLPSHYWLHALVALASTLALFWGLAQQGWLNAELLRSAIAFENFGLSLGLGLLLAIALGSSLSLSAYVLVPLARWLQR